jgi:hypothetical protein
MAFMFSVERLGREGQLEQEALRNSYRRAAILNSKRVLHAA